MRDILQVIRSWTHPTDQVHIERLRRSILAYERWRSFLVALYLVAFAGLMLLSVCLIVFATRMGQNFGQAAVGTTPGFVIGIVLGASFGLTTVKVVHGLLDAVFGLRNERLLIRFHDAYRDLCQQSPGELEAEDGPFEAGHE
jgi:hypothetical protein